VVLLDELDRLVTPKEDVLYNFFDWASNASSKLILVGISNTMDLGHRLSNRVRSRMGEGSLSFEPYTRDELSQIVARRLGDSNVRNPNRFACFLTHDLTLCRHSRQRPLNSALAKSPQSAEMRDAHLKSAASLCLLPSAKQTQSE
jgi:Cdc6-like AAA superfamily ATPase